MRLAPPRAAPPADRFQLRYIREAAKRQRVAVTIVLDLMHVLEYLWKAAYVFFPEGSVEAEGWVSEGSSGC